MGHDPATDTLSDPDLVRLVAAGDRAAFAALFRRRQREVFRFALHMSGASSVADDVTQEVFLAVMRDAGRYEPGRASVAAWLCGIARNHVRRRLDADRSLVSFEGDVVDGEPAGAAADDVLADLVRAERIDAVRRAVAALPVRYREVVVLCDLEGFAYADAASALECAVGTVRSRLHRGRALLALKLGVAERGGEGARGAALPHAEGRGRQEGGARQDGVSGVAARCVI
jgi:RNA polymerase sigma-70 factor (ECF subfamily)